MPQPFDLDAIERRANAATAGPWWNDDHEIYVGAHDATTEHWIGETCNVNDLAASKANGTFIAAARIDVPALVAEVRRLRAELAERRDQVLSEAAEQLIPPWEASYDPATFTPRLLAYCNDLAAAKGAAEAWLRTQVEDVTDLMWVPDPQMAVGEWDQWFQLFRDSPYGGVADTEIVVRRRAARTTAGPADPEEWVRCSDLHCPNGERRRLAAERGWQHGETDTWRCPKCAAARTAAAQEG